MPQDSEAIDLAQALGILRRRAPLILLCVVVVGGAAFGFSKLQTRKYTATAAIVFNSNNPLSQIGLLPSSTSSQPNQQASNIELIGLGATAAKTASLLGHGLTEEKVGKSLSIAGKGESNVVSISATSTSPLLAAKLATTYTRLFVKAQQAANRRYFKSALALVNKQLAELPSTQRFGEAAVELQNHAQTLRLLEGLKFESVQVAQVAAIPSTPSSPKTSKNTAIGGILGLLLGLSLAFILERLYRERLLREPDDVEAVYHLPLLGVVPNSTALASSAQQNGDLRTGLRSAETETFNLIRARLRFFNANRDLRTVLVTAAARGEGTTTITRHLAEAAARMGSRTLLMEVNFRDPTLTQHLGLRPQPGLPDVLRGAVSLDMAIQSVNLESEEPSGDSVKRQALDVLPCGAIPPANPAELIESHAMEIVLANAKSKYDLVLLDTSPLTATSDAFPLLSRIDGVVIISWVGRSPRDLAEQLRQTLDSIGVSQLGIVANGVKPGTPNFYASGPQAKIGKLPSPVSGNGAYSPDAPVPTLKT